MPPNSGYTFQRSESLNQGKGSVRSSSSSSQFPVRKLLSRGYSFFHPRSAENKDPIMTMGNGDFCDVVKQGLVRIKSRNLGIWQRRWLVLRRASSQGPCRLDKYLERFSFVVSKSSSGNGASAGNNKKPAEDAADGKNNKNNGGQLQQQSSNGSNSNKNGKSASPADGNNNSNGKGQKPQPTTTNGVSPDRCHGTPKSTLDLRLMTAVSRVPCETCPSAFLIEFSDGNNRLVACETDQDADDWVATLTHRCLCPCPTGMRKNRMFQAVPAQFDEVFNVYMMPSKKTVISGEVLLQVAPGRVYLWDVDAPQLKLLEWPLKSFKRYGRDATKFSFECGSDCFTGEGTFVFRTKAGDAIYKLVHEATASMAEMAESRRAKMLATRGPATSVAITTANSHDVIHSVSSYTCSGNGGVVCSSSSGSGSLLSKSYSGRPSVAGAMASLLHNEHRLHQSRSAPTSTISSPSSGSASPAESASSSGSATPQRPPRRSQIHRNYTIGRFIPGEIYDEMELLQLIDDDAGIELSAISPCNIIIGLH